MADLQTQAGSIEAHAIARHVRMSPQKARLVIDLIRGRKAQDALQSLRFTPKRAAKHIEKVLRSAIANAEHARQLDPSSLVVSRAWVDEGPTLKRFRPRAQGRGARILKRTSHITVIVAERDAASRERTR